MHIKKADKPLEWNLNTIVSLITLVTMLFGGAWTIWNGGRYVENFSNRIEDLENWRESYNSGVRERRAEVEAALARLSTQASAIDDRLVATENMTVRLSDRQAAADARNVELATAVRDLQTAINEQSGDLKVIRAWIDEQRSVGGSPR